MLFRSLSLVVEAGPDVLNHNIETVPRLYAAIRPEADYRRSLGVLAGARRLDPGLAVKSGLIVGLGETSAEVLQVLRDLRAHDCQLLTIGQYLAPSRQHYPVAEYVHPDTFDYYRLEALKLGFSAVASGPLIRSSYMAENLFSDSREQLEVY